MFVAVLLDHMMTATAFALTFTMIRIVQRLGNSPKYYRLLRRGFATTTPLLSVHNHGHLPTSQSPIVSKLHFFNSVTGDGTQIPTYRVLDGSGKLIEGAEMPEVFIYIVLICYFSQNLLFRLTKRSLVECGSGSWHE